MKKYLFLATTIATASLFTGCSNNEYVGDQPEAFNGTDGAIVFSMGKANTTRTEPIGGQAAAGKLNKQFWVYGWKTVEGSAPNPQLVFKNYKVTYLKDSPSSSNTNDWEYVGQQEESASVPQTIKYWDYSASKYDFEAYSKTTGSVVRKDAGDYEVTQLDSPEDLYFAVKKTMTKPENGGKYDVVKLTFQSVLSKIRVGFYETIPGYSVKIDGFYPLQSGENPNDFANASNTESKNFFAWCPNKAANTHHPFVVTYVTDNDVDPAVTTPTVTKVANDANSDYIEITNNESYKLDAQLTLGTNLRTQNQIGETSSAVTWDNIDNNNKPIYTYFIPQNQLVGGKVKEMKIKVDYTLTSDDQSGEVINVTGATAIVPKEYLRWKPNTAYSYVFKISDQTNGTTGTPGTDPAGLYPITFDAVVTEMAEDYLTTVSDLSITATQGEQFADANNAVFKTGQDKPIKVKVMYNNGDITSNFNPDVSDGFKAVFTTDYNPNLSIEDNFSGATQTITYNSSDVVIKLDGKDDPGYWIVKVTYTADGKDITKYAVLKVGTETPSTSGNGEGGE